MARERHVYPTDEVCHRWAHGSELDLYNQQRSVFTDGDTIYSYGHHFPMARRVVLAKHGPKVDGKRQDLVVFLVNPGSYSVTTSGHQAAVRSALSGAGDQTYHLPPIFWQECVYGGSGKNVRAYFEGLVKKAGADMHNNRMGYWRRSQAIQHAAEQIENWVNIQDAFHFRTKRAIAEPALPDLSEAKAKEEARRAACEETRRRKWAAYEEERRLRQEQYEREQRERAEQERATLDERLAAWRAGEHVSTALFEERVTGALMRVKDGQIETSRGARVTVAEAIRFITEDLPRLREAELTDGEAEFRDMHIGPYHRVRVTEGGFSVGCHDFSWAEANRMIGELRAQRWIVTPEVE